MSKFINFFFKFFGFALIRSKSLSLINLEILKEPIIEDEYKELISRIEKIYGDRISHHSLYSVYTLCNYIYKNKIEGDIIECGVYEGACIAMVLMFFSSKKDFSRSIYLYDTYEGMTKPDLNDFHLVSKKKHMDEGYNYCSLENVKENLSTINYDYQKIHYIKGDVMHTLPKSKHDKISLLRLDTDFYKSTKIELETLYKHIIKGGFIIYDDYGHWKGQFDAVEEFYKSKKINPLMIRSSRKERIAIKLI
tara:strand:- start:398 stop:1147 length:750 start_codon:yes stop_codon:yes gene_type:complete